MPTGSSSNKGKGDFTVIDRTELSKAYFTRKKIAQHHIDSFNVFLEQGLQKVIDEQGYIETDIEDIEHNIEPVKVKLGKIRVGNPVVREADGSVEPLFPTEARLRNITYAAEIFLEMAIVRGEVEGDYIEVNIGQMPIMIGSSKCNLARLSADDWVKNGEDPVDPGGYFIINGTERVIMTLEDLAPNKIMVEFDDRYGDQIEVAKVFSQRRGYRALVIVERGRKSILEVSFPSISGRLNLVMLMRALGLETDAGDRQCGLGRPRDPEVHAGEPRRGRGRQRRDRHGKDRQACRRRPGKGLPAEARPLRHRQVPAYRT